jgi:hypothetical protein
MEIPNVQFINLLKVKVVSLRSLKKLKLGRLFDLRIKTLGIKQLNSF